jgi:ABC-type sugar transport system substrate-binding protein
MQRQAYFNALVDRAFASCQGPCKLAAVGGFVGSDLFNLWENAIKTAGAKYSNVNIVADQPGNYDPRVTLRIVQDALRAHPDLNLVISPWDDMTRGADQAITSVGKKPGSDVLIHSIGGTKDAITHIKDGSYNETTVLLPWEEAYYGGVAMVMAIEGKPLNAYVNEALLPAVMQGPGTIFITKENVDKFSPNY